MNKKDIWIIGFYLKHGLASARQDKTNLENPLVPKKAPLDKALVERLSLFLSFKASATFLLLIPPTTPAIVSAAAIATKVSMLLGCTC